ncbi:type II secretion system protein J [Tateyamaria armeniaca]|uniref:Type II secretion system protein J n=1 Tax=Tateyamaria armeniaca TaxID=2518930 RepID=A0ABW8USQ1_9RHOB
MTGRRSAQAGVTLIEMLVALAISSLVGLAGFVLLESVTRTEAGVAGRLERLALQDRAFHLFALDVESAGSASFDEALVLQVSEQVVTWMASDSGLTRRIEFTDRPAINQRILDKPAALMARGPGALALVLTERDVWRLVALPEEVTQ